MRCKQSGSSQKEGRRGEERGGEGIGEERREGKGEQRRTDWGNESGKIRSKEEKREERRAHYAMPFDSLV